MTETMDPKEALVEIYCKQLKLPGLKTFFRELSRDAMTHNQTSTAFLAACLARELESRQQKRLTTMLKQARFPEVKTWIPLILRPVPSCLELWFWRWQRGNLSGTVRTSSVSDSLEPARPLSPRCSVYLPFSRALKSALSGSVI
jgi:hypothetical protein